MSMIGRNLGNFEITSQIGRGGMGEVYRAKDLKLGRDVAIKLLPEEFARDADRVARFQREAKLLASLNHPNIAAIHGLEVADGTNFLILELVEGETLADRLKRGPIPVEESLKLALQIAEALEAAHEKGVIHRDLKPANIKVTPDGKVKILDFGLAKAFAAEQSGLNLSNSPTLSEAATMQGVILGTAAYMPPEQAKGKAVDKRADIWAFGVVLFEMLSGRQLFSGETVSETLAAVLMKEPDFSALPQNLHPKLLEMLERCLEKDTGNRYHDIGDVRVEIQKVLADPGGVFVKPIPIGESRSKLLQMLPWIAAALVLGSIIAGVTVWKLKPTEARPVMRFTYDLPEDQRTIASLAVSPDGNQLVYGSLNGLYLRSMEELTARLIPGTEGAAGAFFSPDGKWIGYWSIDLQLKKIAISGGAPVTICESSNIIPFIAASWGADGMIAVATAGGIMRVSANGGTPEEIVKGEKERFRIRFSSPQILPDGKSILFTVSTERGSQVAVQSLESGKRKNLFAGDSARYLPTGHLVYALENNLFAIPFDLKTLEPAGGPVSMVEGVLRIGRFSPALSSVSDSGTLVYVPGTTASALPSTPRNILVWVDRQGKVEPVAAEPNDYRSLGLSPDGMKVAVAIRNGDKSDIWIWDFIRETMTRLTFNENSSSPLWTPDGKRIFFAAGKEDKKAIYWRAADGTGKDELLSSVSDGILFPWSWSGDGKTLVTIKQPPLSPYPLLMIGRRGGPAPKRSPGSERSSIREGNFFKADIGSLSMEGEHEWKPLLHEEYIETNPRISPDGRWIAYVSNESEPPEIYVRPFPEVDNGKWQVSTGGAVGCLWSPDGRELFYFSSDLSSLMQVEVETKPTFKLGKSKAIFNLRDAGVSLASFMSAGFDVSPDGKRFLMLKQAATTPDEPTPARPGKIIVVANWFEELKQRVPVH